VKTTGKYSYKMYRCTRCGREQLQGTNHWGEIYTPCPVCSWKNPKEAAPTWVCLEPRPEGYGVPEPWKNVKLGDTADVGGKGMNRKELIEAFKRFLDTATVEDIEAVCLKCPFCGSLDLAMGELWSAKCEDIDEAITEYICRDCDLSFWI
jgi:DNA-directed RNA polymerase subunit RPC12/RpoP